MAAMLFLGLGSISDRWRKQGRLELLFWYGIHTATIIDNIFSNITDYETVSGGITTHIDDHFAQFLLIKNAM